MCNLDCFTTSIRSTFRDCGRDPRPVEPVRAFQSFLPIDRSRLNGCETGIDAVIGCVKRTRLGKALETRRCQAQHDLAECDDLHHDLRVMLLLSLKEISSSGISIHPL